MDSSQPQVVLPPEPVISEPVPLLKTDVLGKNTPKNKTLFFTTALWVFGAFLVGILFFSFGYSLRIDKGEEQNNQPEVVVPDVGLTLFEKFGTTEQIAAGVVRFEFWFDLDGDGKKTQWEMGRDGVGINVRRKGEELPFISMQSDGEGVIKLTGLDEGEYEINYYVNPYENNYGPTADQHFWGQKRYEIFTSENGPTGMLPTEWEKLSLNPNGTNITVGLKEYKPQNLVAVQNKQLILYDPVEKFQFSSSNIWDESSFPKKFEVRDNKIFYVKGGVFYKYDLLSGSNGYSEKIYDQVVAPDDSYYAISPNGTTIVYGGHDGTFFQSPATSCGKQMLRFENKPIEMYTTSYPYDAIAARFQNETHALIYGRTDSDSFRFFTTSCDGQTLTITKLPVLPVSFSGGYISFDRIIFKGPVNLEKTCGDTPCKENYGEGLYKYDLAEKKFEQIGGSEFNRMNFTHISHDGKYAWLTNYEDGSIKILDFRNKEQTHIINLDLKSQFTNYTPSSVRDTTVTYSGNDTFMFVDIYGECGKQKDCATVKKFTMQNDNISPVQEVLKIQDIYPQRLIGEVTR